MRARASQLFPVLLALALALATLWLDRLVQLSPSPLKDKLRHDPDFIVENFTLTRMSPRGKPESSLTAPKMLHYPDDESTDLEHPRYLQHSDDRPTVEIVGDRGKVSKDGETVHVEGNVVVTRAGANGGPPLQVRTTVLEIDPKNEIARTDAPVTITEGDAVLRGVGMVVNGKTRELELKNRVQGTYPPKR
jgi:lipopolysaccharide export system protein LptC